MSTLVDLTDDRGRPVTFRTASKMSHIDTVTLVDPVDTRPRCRRCGHVVFTAESIRLGIGLACRRALANYRRYGGQRG